MRITVFVVDDHAEFRESARALLEAEGFDVVGEAADGGQTIAGVARVQPQVVLLDVQLPDMDGFAVAERLAQTSDPPAVVLTSGRDPQTFAARLASSPVRGFIPKRDLSGAALAGLVA